MIMDVTRPAAYVARVAARVNDPALARLVSDGWRGGRSAVRPGVPVHVPRRLRDLVPNSAKLAMRESGGILGTERGVM